jgi:hypothetical protein
VLLTAADSPAASAKGTVKPSAMPMTASRTVAEPVKCFSICGVAGIASPCLEPVPMRRIEKKGCSRACGKSPLTKW